MYYIFLSITYFFAELMNSPILSISDCYVRYLGKFLEPVVGGNSHWLLCWRASLRVSMGWWLLRLSAKILALLRLSVNFFQLRLTDKATADSRSVQSLAIIKLFRAANAFRVTWSERVRHRNALTEIAWEDAVQGLGIMSTVASEKNKEMLFIGNVFYKQ